MQIQLVYGLNYAKNAFKRRWSIAHLLFQAVYLSHPLPFAHFWNLSFVRHLIHCVLLSNQYFTVHALQYAPIKNISMLKNLWASLHICSIYSYSGTHKKRAYITHTLQFCLPLILHSFFPLKHTHTHFICSFILFCFVALRCVFQVRFAKKNKRCEIKRKMKKINKYQDKWMRVCVYYDRMKKADKYLLIRPKNDAFGAKWMANTTLSNV